MLSSKSLMTVALTSAALVNVSHAWWGTGHMLVARIAFDKLTASNPEVLTRANGILTGIASFTELEKDYPFVECATFADEIKGKGWDTQSHWHFVDEPLFEGDFHKDVPSQQYNVTWAIGEMVRSLKSAKPPADVSSTTELVSGGKKPKGPGVSFALGDSFNLRLLIHYVGDVHQPLHGTSRFSEAHPDGDEGGNFFLIEQVDEIKELHALWDSVLTEFATDLTLPLTEDDWSSLGDSAATLAKAYPESGFDDIANDYTTWSTESFNIAQSTVYSGINEGDLPTDEYLAKGKAVAEQQIAKAGYRLANMLISWWGAESATSQGTNSNTHSHSHTHTHGDATTNFLN